MIACPIEIVLAANPPVITCGRIKLRPLTIERAFRLMAYGVDPVKHLSMDQIAIAVEVLTDGKVRSLSRRTDFKALYKAVEQAFNVAFKTFIPALQSASNISMSPSGLGWILELTEALLAEYGWTWEYVLSLPLARAFALQAAMRQRHGGKHGGPDYIERPIVEKMKGE